MMRSFVSTLLTLLLLPGMALGQAQKGSLTVTVSAEDGSRLPGVTIEAKASDTLTTRSAVTGPDGVASLIALDPSAGYVVTTVLEGFNGSRNENVLVRAGSTTPIFVTLSLATVTEEVIVTAESPVVDVTSAIAGQEITLELTEALPTARSYQDYLQLVPGVQAAIGTSSNPASRSGVNYADVAGAVGSSSDNFYYFEGINVTDNVNGNFGANLNTEIIQEQSVLTGGLPAEFVGATGLVSNVITKSGGNDFSGSINYYHQDDSLVSDNKNAADSSFSTYDTAVTLGGPIVQDKAWFFASYRLTSREEDVVPLGETAVVRTPKVESDQAFGKVTWALSQSDLVSATFLSDPQEQTGSTNRALGNARDFSREQGGERFAASYSRVWSSLVFDAGFSHHEGDLNDSPSAFADGSKSLNSVTFLRGDAFTQAQQQLGSFGQLLEDTRGNDAYRGSLEALASTSWGDHTLKAGYEFTENEHFRNSTNINDSTYTSLAGRYAGLGVTANQLTTSSVRDFLVNNTSDFNGFLKSVNQLAGAQKAAVYAALDTNHDGTLTSAEVGANLRFNEANTETGDGSLFYDRTFQSESGEQTTNSEGTVWFLQDQWQWGKFSANVGVRAEEWEHLATNGASIFTFDTEYAPRVSLVYDLKGDGKQRLSAYYGRYYDPIRNNLTNFAGSLTGRVLNEQVRVCVPGFCDWVTYRTRGGAKQQDAFFSPSTQTPYTDELTLSYKIDLGRNMSFEASYIDRKTRDIVEDYDLGLYSTPEGYGLPVDHPDSLFLPFSVFGYDSRPNSNFVIGTLVGGERNWEGVELVFRKRMSNHWQMLGSYNWADGTGNTNSDSNSDFGGDALMLDPRAPNMNTTQAGLVEHLFKIAGTYQFDNGLQVGGKYRWNSGVISNRSFRASGRNLPVFDVNEPAPGNTTPVDPIVFAGGDGNGVAGGAGNWVSPFAVGTVDNPDYGILDLRLAYLWRLGGRYEADFFVDVFNVLDDQEITQSQELVAGGAGADFGEGLNFVEPRRLFLGARLRF